MAGWDDGVPLLLLLQGHLQAVQGGSGGFLWLLHHIEAHSAADLTGAQPPVAHTWAAAPARGHRAARRRSRVHRMPATHLLEIRAARARHADGRAAARSRTPTHARCLRASARVDPVTYDSPGMCMQPLATPVPAHLISGPCSWPRRKKLPGRASPCGAARREHCTHACMQACMLCPQAWSVGSRAAARLSTADGQAGCCALSPAAARRSALKKQWWLYSLTEPGTAGSRSPLGWWGVPGMASAAGAGACVLMAARHLARLGRARSMQQSGTCAAGYGELLASHLRRATLSWAVPGRQQPLQD